MANCASQILRGRTSATAQTHSTTEKIETIAGVEVAQPQYDRLITKYNSYIPKSGIITIDDLRRMPQEAKSMCDAQCRLSVKKYLQEHGGKINLSDPNIRDHIR